MRHLSKLVLASCLFACNKHKDQAWKWVKFLASPEAQKIVGSYGVVFPAIPEATEVAKTKMTASGVDVSAFVSEANEEINALFD
jgi:multiple sugar transport system substrate-binding protein